MESVNHLIEIESLLIKLKTEFFSYKEAVKKEIDYIEESQNFQFDLTHLIESVDLTEEESLTIIQRLQSTRRKRRQCKDGVKLSEINKPSLNLIDSIVGKVFLKTSVETKFYQMRTEEGQTLAESFTNVNERSQASLLTKKGKELKSTANKLISTTNKKEQEYNLDKSKELGEEVSLIKSEPLDKEFKTNAAKAVFKHLYKTNESKSEKEKSVETIKPTKPVVSKTVISQEKLDSVLQELRNLSTVLTKSKGLWIIKSSGKVLIKSSKLNKVLEFAKSAEIHLTVDTKYIHAVSSYVNHHNLLEVR